MVELKAEKLVLIGLDGVFPEFLTRFFSEDKLPNIGGLVKNGFYSEALPCPPCDTPTNWTTIMTGAWTGTHGITSFHSHIVGEPLSKGMISCRNTELSNAEFLWDVAERFGKKSLIFDYPAGWPPTSDTSIVIGGWYSSKRGSGAGLFGMASNEISLENTYPSKLAEELARELGPPYLELNSLEPKVKEKSFDEDFDIFFKVLDYRINYFIDVVKYVQKKYGWDLLISHIHGIDNLNHKILNRLWKDHPKYDQEKATEAWEIYEQAFFMLDKMIGRILKESTDKRTCIVLVSDHGAVPSSKIAWVGNSLRREGLLSYKRDSETNELLVDWEKTKAAFYFSPPEYIWINLEGREPNGIVRMKEYETVREEVIQALYNTRDSETNECPISLALRKEDAEIFGHWGDRCADIVYFVKPQYFLPDFTFDTATGKTPTEALEYLFTISDAKTPEEPIASKIEQGSHHGHLPTDKMGPCSNRSILIMTGPGIRQNYKRSHPIWLTDVAPTIAYLLNLPQPAQCEGNIITDVIK